MTIPGAILVPHPPVILPPVGRGREEEIRKTTEAYRAAAGQVVQWKPDVLILMSPHMVLYSDYFHIAPGRSAVGDMKAFGVPGMRLKVDYDQELRTEIIREAEKAHIRAGTQGEQDRNLDHGSFIPLWFLQQAGLDCPVVRIGLSGFSPLIHYQLGQCIQRAVSRLRRRAVVVASGDLSHKLKEDGPYGFAPDGPRFDRAVTDAMASSSFLEFLTMDSNLCQRAAQCGLGSLQIMAGILDGMDVKSELLSYESTFGVGYGVATVTVLGRAPERKYADRYLELERDRLEAQRAAEDPWVRLARLTLETYVRSGTRAQIPPDLPPEMLECKGGTFVSLHLDGQLRGCIGTIRASTSCIATEIMTNAVSAGTRDPRFPPVRKEELDRLEYSVDVLGPAEDIASPAELDVKKYGVIVRRGQKRGLLLPDLDGVDTVQEQIDIACRKAGIPRGESVELQRFEVVRHR